MELLNLKGKYFTPIKNFWAKDCHFPQKINDILIQKQRRARFLITKNLKKGEKCTIFAIGNTVEGQKKIKFSTEVTDLFNKIKIL